jgi:UDP-N-acetylglucosamine (GlcNAc):hydroxyproline polypeptide GlcNAc-transferase
MKQRVYVQIPAYRDSELLVTVKDLMRTAEEPQRLRVGIAWQYAEEEEKVEASLRRWTNVELKKIPAVQSQGCNWARSLLQQNWDGEKYTLFLDSHHRFVPGWDEQVIRIYEERKAKGFDKPIITGYLPPYDPSNDPAGRIRSLFKIHMLERHQGMLFRLTGHELPQWSKLAEPVPAHFASLHFLFTDGSFNREIAFDPSIYFFADEVAIALRAYTFGYDLFHPHRILGWHLYDRTTRATHWSDHLGWKKQNEASCRRLRELFSGALYGKHGLGRARKLSDYEEFVGMKLISGRA